jgi:hypothetical protein
MSDLIERIEKLTPEPGDVIVLHTPDLTEDHMETIRADLVRWADGQYRVLILTGDMTIEALTAEQLGEAGLAPIQ